MSNGNSGNSLKSQFNSQLASISDTSVAGMRIGLGRCINTRHTALLSTDGPWDLVKFLIPECYRKRMSITLCSALGMTSQIRLSSSYTNRIAYELSCHGIELTKSNQIMHDIPIPENYEIPNVRVPLEMLIEPARAPAADSSIAFSSGSPSLQYLNQRKHLSTLLVKNLLPFNTRKGDAFNVNSVLGYFCMKFKGREHSGLADSMNIARILSALLWHGDGPCAANVEYALDMSLVPEVDEE
jgi:hypothetical protein